MLSAVKFISRDRLNAAEHESDSGSSRNRKKKHSGKEKQRSRRRHDSSDEEEEIEKKKKKKKKGRKRSKWSSSGDSSESEDDIDRHKYKRRRGNKERSTRNSSKSSEEPSLSEEVEAEEPSPEPIELVRKEMGLEWMLKPSDRPPLQNSARDAPSEPLEEEKPKSNPKELNPYLKDGGSGYPEDDGRDPREEIASRLLSPTVVGDGGASWRLKALRRAQEQAAREGRKLDEVVEERWGSLGQMAASVATIRAAPARAHLHAIRDRKREQKGDPENTKNENNDSQIDMDDQRIRGNKREYLNDVTIRDSYMKTPKIHDSLLWRNKRKDHFVRPEDADLIQTAASSLNKYVNDGSFFEKFNKQKNKECEAYSTSADMGNERGSSESSQVVSAKDEKGFSDASKQQSNNGKFETAAADHSVNAQVLSTNQLAARAMQLRLKGKHAEADELLKESQKIADAQKLTGHKSVRQADDTTFDLKALRGRSKGASEENADAHLASKIMNNKQYNTATQADDEYDFDVSDTRESHKKKKNTLKQQMSRHSVLNVKNRILTQQERCHFCFDNPSRPKHLVISIANFTYLMLPLWEPIVQGHCYILPMQHESSTRNLDDNVWEELRNFKKCLLRMYAERDKDVLFLETAMGLAQQRRHCLVECIPLPQDIAKEAPLYFKKAIDEAEEEWSQHNAKKLIDTSVKGLRGSIPKNFPYFHVEFGLNKGFVHVIDDEKNFKSHFGLNVVRGMLQIQEEDMYRRRKQYSFEMQKKAALDFSREWEPFDWTKMLD